MKNSEQPAFPITDEILSRAYEGLADATYVGLTKREYIAAMALQGLLSNEFVSNFVDKIPGYSDQMGKIYAKMAIDFTDELLEKL